MANTRILRYPYEALTEKTDYLQIDAKSYTAIGKSDKTDETSLVGKRLREDVSLPGKVDVPKTNNRPVINEGTVFLPIPSNIQDGNAVTYADDSLNGIVAAAIGPITGMMKSVDPKNPSAIMTKFSGNLKQLSTLALSEDVQKAIGRSLASQAVGIFNGNVTPDQILARQSGEIFNPNILKLF